MCEDTHLSGETPEPLQFLFQLAQAPTFVHSHELRLEKALDGVAGQIHGATIATGVQKCPRVVHAVLTRFALIGDAIEKIVHHGKNAHSHAQSTGPLRTSLRV